MLLTESADPLSVPANQLPAKPESPQEMTARRVRIAGATGYLGSRLVAQLRALSMPVVAILKDKSCEADHDRLSALGATLAFVDASRIESYAQVLSGAQIAISCMASGNLDVDLTDDFWAIDRDASIRFGLEAVRAGATHVILVATFEWRDSRRQPLSIQVQLQFHKPKIRQGLAGGQKEGRPSRNAESTFCLSFRHQSLDRFRCWSY